MKKISKMYLSEYGYIHVLREIHIFTHDKIDN